MKYPFPKSARLCKRHEFKRAAQNAERYVGACVIIDHSSTETQGRRLGIIVTRKHGNSCVRNRAKRLIREAFRQVVHELPPGIDLIMRPRNRILKAVCADVQNDLLSFIRLVSSKAQKTEVESETAAVVTLELVH